ncbi:hypothetical protein EGR_02973 [Echinococcus granulosus]|uniref:Uncharacterized protein n=1 Tax=Echinococcus granulosus TaxID=6210 RepID=W6UM58_ECHGR|nr:hypothetical protein EGR_02973 [Echinococcus granulosus]EUB62221.1 hypothetical protein EGR_02973 [Echinococcus granulosus]
MSFGGAFYGSAVVLRRVTIRIRALALVSSWNNKFAPVNYFKMFSPGSISVQGSFKLVLPDRMSCDVPFQEPVKYPLYKDPECYEHCLNAALLTASISEDRFCFMLEPGKNKKTLELVVPALPSSTFGFKSPRTSDTILASNISVTEFLEALIAEPQIRHLWVQVQPLTLQTLLPVDSASLHKVCTDHTLTSFGATYRSLIYYLRCFRILEFPA